MSEITKYSRVRVVRGSQKAWYGRLVPIIFEVCDMGGDYYIPILMMDFGHDWATIKKMDCEFLGYI